MKRLIGEFEEQSFTQIIFPHAKSDWAEYLQEAEQTFINIINAIIKYQKCLVVCSDVQYVKRKFSPHANLYFTEYETDDTWARDSSALCVQTDKGIELYNFIFNGWGNKFKASKDNAMNETISKQYSKKLKNIDFILEGGAIESNGGRIILTTSKCLFNPNRNKNLTQTQITQKLKEYFESEEILYLHHGYLAGDDTDSHIDTLARFIDEETIIYVRCRDETDEHYKELKLMEDELKNFAKEFNLKLIALPFPHAIYHDNERLPATYANFLFVNGAILVPTYGVAEDEIALSVFKKVFATREIVPINCSTLIKQHGSLHCVTMNFARGVTLV